jgi:hypothetical protein
VDLDGRCGGQGQEEGEGSERLHVEGWLGDVEMDMMVMKVLFRSRRLNLDEQLLLGTRC